MAMLGSTDDLDHFLSMPWCAALLNAPDVVPFTPTSRLEGDHATRSMTQDQLFRKSLNGSDTIPRCVGFYHDKTDQIIAEAASSPAPARLLVESISVLFDLQPGVNGFNGTAHGGLIASLIDEAMGSMFLVNNVVQAIGGMRGGNVPPGIVDLSNLRVFTAGMDVRFQKPVRTPGVVVVTSSFVKTEGRKIFMDVRLTDEKGVENARCDAVWLSRPLEKV
ncbi:HotDog domain-containing protein [Plectosphaerella cucumerina]|jgi:acyl-coenzyme A thioesterase PaaI-like protein|uniref:HotDog domain-containing protein n=1 Tax=Plectosphaerella cucumerina TaxID=40658 RepID=A0A8K0TS16_9PEZI|nr:HotDog domain-containing protein [Plectosphaerella cucumerina]